MKHITLTGLGNHSGDGPDNSMSLADAYGKLLLPGSEPRSSYCVVPEPRKREHFKQANDPLVDLLSNLMNKL